MVMMMMILRLRMMWFRVVMLRVMRWRMMMSRGRKRMMWRMMMLRRRKRMILRMLMWRRRTDPKTELRVLFERAQSKCTSTFHKSHSKNAATQNLGPHFVRACAVGMHFNISQEPLYYGNLRQKRCGPEPRTTLCASLHSDSRNASQHFTRATLYGNLQKKCRGPKPRRRLCASLRSRNALQHFTRAALHRNLHEKCRAPE